MPRPNDLLLQTASRLDLLSVAMIQTLSICFASFLLCACARESPAPLQHEAYVWERIWTSAVTQAMTQSEGFVAGWHVLLAETTVHGQWQQLTPAIPGFGDSRHTLVAVFRINGQRPLDDISALVDQMQKSLQTQPSIHWSGVEIDYDCPSRSLSQYLELVQRIRQALPSMRLSITALPTWISSPALKPLLESVDASVLQLHSVLDPRRGLFDSQKALQWIGRYSTLTNHNFSIALPDYGSRVGWDSSGHLVSIVSEQSTPDSVPDQNELMAKTGDIAAFLKSLRDAHPARLSGVVWFRLPTVRDKRIWSLSTLEAVIRGKAIEDRRMLRVDRDNEGAYRITVVNTGDLDAILPSTINTGACVAADGMSGYSAVHAAGNLVFVRQDTSLVRAGSAVMVGWTRCPVRQEDLHLEDE